MTKTYQKTTTTTEPRLVISHDDMTPSPREDSNLGYWITIDREYESPDNHLDFEEIIKETGDEANSQAEHIEMIKKEIESRLGDKIVAIYPTVKYEHGGVSYSLGEKHGFDYSNNGFYIITEKTLKEIGVDNNEEAMKRIIIAEIQDYNKWINGEVYRFMLYDEAGEIEDSCGGFYDLETMKEYLPAEWKDENLEDYLKVC